MTPKQLNDAFMQTWDQFGDSKSTEFLVQITAERCKVNPSVVYDALASTHSRRPAQGKVKDYRSGFKEWLNRAPERDK